METHTDTTAYQLANLINEAADAMVDLDKKINELEALKSSLATDILRAQDALDRIQAQEYADEIREEEPTPEPDTSSYPARFEVGGVYTYRLATDASTLYEVTVVARTAKFVTIQEGHRGPERQVQRKVNLTAEGVEYVMPDGRYSMAPLLSAASRID